MSVLIIVSTIGEQGFKVYSQMHVHVIHNALVLVYEEFLVFMVSKRFRVMVQDSTWIRGTGIGPAFL